jgi:hypothetical protein
LLVSSLKQVKPSTISTTQLNALPHLHLWPIKQVVYLRSFSSCEEGRSNLGAGFTLRCFQRLSAPNLATQPCRGRDNWHTICSFSWILSYYRKTPSNLRTPTTDRDRPVSRRSEPSSRAALTGEQPDPWDLLQPQDATSRHRGAKPCRRYELLGKISLLSPG